MHFIKSILILISSLSIVGQAVGGAYELEKADSIYQHLTPSGRLHQLVLMDTEGGEIPRQYGHLGGIYHAQPLETPQTLHGKLVVVQLDDRLNPLPGELVDLPGLYTLAALTKPDLLTSYFEYLEASSRAAGVDILVLPGVADTTSEIGVLLSRMKSYNPDFFLQKNELSFSKARRKNEIIGLFEDNQYWVVSDQGIRAVSQLLEKHSEKVLSKVDLEDRVRESILRQVNGHTSRPIGQMPNQLAVAISKASVVPLQKIPGTFPLKRDTVCFLTNQPYGSTANMLRKYAYVITAYEEIVSSNAPIILDNDSFVPPGILSEEKQVVYIGMQAGFFKHLAWIDAALLYHSASESYSYVIPQQIFGSSEITGRLPYSSPHYAQFRNNPIHGTRSLGYAPPEITGLDRIALSRIEAIMAEAIQSGCTPGGQLAIAVDGAIVLDQAYGHLTYDSLVPTERTTLYDLASVTKVTATLLAVMKLYEEGQLYLDATLGQYLPSYTGSNKEHITIRSLLAHNAGLKPYVPFWQRALTADFMETFYYENDEAQREDKRSYGIKPNTILQDTLKNWILKSPLIVYDSIPPYSYSDIGFMILHQVIETIAGQPMDQYLKEHFYTPMKLQRLTFNPLNNGFERYQIAPTEHDYYFREELVWGVVHDRNAAVFGGVAGHAGLFANAHDLTIVLQTLLQGGSYGGIQYLQPSTIGYFNQCFFEGNRRALGWDKKDDAVGNASVFSSLESFGHTGFTGTMIWADPAYDLIFIFLSNRIHPNSNNYKLIRNNIRTRIQDVVYEALMANWVK